MLTHTAELINPLQLKDPDLFRQQCFVDGRWIGEGNTPVLNPDDQSLLGHVPCLRPPGIQEAIESAEQSFRIWSSMTARDRSNVLIRWAELCMENQQDLAKIITLEQGKPLTEASGEIVYGASFIDWFAGEGRRIYGDTIPSNSPSRRIVTLKQPVGVVAAVTPWNFPNAMISRKAGAALAAGCSIIVKPAPETPFSAFALAVLAERAGIPPGVFNVVTGDAVEITEELIRSTTVRKLSFTGSTEVGRLLYRKCADTVKKISLELGGNAPFIVFDDADLDSAVEGLLIAKFRNSGQTCVCANRIFIQDGVYDKFAEKLAAKVKKLRVGCGLNEGVQIGPLINRGAVEKVQLHIEDAVNRGAEIYFREGDSATLRGFYVAPTVLTDVQPGSLLFGEETFGPVAPLIRFSSEEDVIRMSNDTESGLAAYFYTRDLSRAWRVSAALEYGMVGINEGLISTEVAPFGGIKQSGLGREGSKYGIEDYLELKYLCFNLSQ